MAAEVVEQSVGAFRARARAWLAENMPPLVPGRAYLFLADDEDVEREHVARSRELQRRLFDGGFAGICYPREYGGLGLTAEYQRAFNDECTRYEMPVLFTIPSLSIIGPTLLDFGTEEQKRRHIPAILRGEELWVQFLSEPTGGSDLAGAVTRANRDGDVFVLSGSKIWTSGAHRSDYALCLARTNWEAPKHRGLTMFIVPIHQPGIHVERIRMVNGSREFCQEFFDDVSVPAADVVGAADDGWTVASRLLFHERNAVGGGSPYLSGSVTGPRGAQTGSAELVALARSRRKEADSHARQLVAEAHALDVVSRLLSQRVATGIATGAMPGPAGAIMRLFAGMAHVRRSDIALELGGGGAGAWTEGEPSGSYAEFFLSRQGFCLGGGSTEMQRNIISERVLDMPREPSPDRELPFGQVRRNAMPRHGG